VPSDNQFTLTITQDKLVDLLMHAATREDIAKLDKKIDDLENRMEAKFEKIDDRFDKIDTRFEKMDSKFEKMDNKYDKIIWGVITAILVPIAIQIFPSVIK
jgi:hypothetical protein